MPWVALAAALLTLPNLAAAYFPQPTVYGTLLFVHGVGLLLLPCAIGLRARTLLGLALPLALLVPGAMSYLLFTGTLPSTFAFLALIESDSQELSVFQSKIWLAAGLIPLVAAVCWWIARQRVPRDFKLGLVARGCVLGAVLVPVLGDLRVGLRETGLGVFQRLTATFPAGTAFSAYEACCTRREFTGRAEVLKGIVVEEEKTGAADARQVHVLVIGESARFASFQIFGYERPTTPLLSKVPGLLAFSDVVAPAPVTLASVPQIITPATPGYVRETASLPSIPAVFRKAGYKVYWISTQRKHGVFDTTTSIFSEDADEARFLAGKFDSAGSATYGTVRDDELQPAVESILARNEPRVLLVVHTMGSHAPYNKRYAPELERFRADPELMMGAMRSLSPSREQIGAVTNAYDNTIAATDRFLDTLISTLRQLDASSFLYYVADHGENGGDSPIAPFAHGTITPDVLHVPMFVWMSPRYEAAHPAQAGALRSRTAEPFAAMNTFHTMLDMAGLRTNLLQREKSLASGDYRPGPRLVLVSLRDHTLVDYDRDLLPVFRKRPGWHPFSPAGRPAGVTAQVR
jgi:glucan phosphoethanolaminetransferase (alkaline phosphatase superfamily)